MQGGYPIFGVSHLKAGFSQHFGIKLADVRLVFHHKDALGRMSLTLKRRFGRPAFSQDFMRFHNAVD
jgi:hypothetical protein